MSERSLGDRWAEGRRADGDFVMKIPASSTAGIPDWIVCGAPYGLQFFEAKRTGSGALAYCPEQLSASQRFVLGAIARKWKPAAQLLILDETGYLEMNYTTRPLTRAVFDRRKRRYV